MFAGKMGDRVGIFGGVVTTGAVSVFINDIPVAKVGSIVKPHGFPNEHKATMMTGSPTVRVEDMPLCRSFDFATCKDVLIPMGTITVEVD